MLRRNIVINALPRQVPHPLSGQRAGELGGCGTPLLAGGDGGPCPALHQGSGSLQIYAEVSDSVYAAPCLTLYYHYYLH